MVDHINFANIIFCKTREIENHENKITVIYCKSYDPPSLVFCYITWRAFHQM